MNSMSNPWASTSSQSERPRLRSSTGPGGYHPIPLTPSAIHNADDVFFMTPPPLPASPMPPRLPYPQDYIPRSSPNLRRVKTAPPPIPPHPYSNRHPSPPRTASAPPPAETVQILPSRSAGPPYAPPPVPEEQAEEAPAPPEPGPPASVDQQPAVAESVRAEELERTPPQDAQAPPQEDDAELAELAAVLALSQAEKLKQEKLRETMQSQEEADLARALEASLSAPSWTTSFSYDAQNYATSAGSSTQPPHSPIPEMNYMDDESFARMLAAQEHDEEIPAFSPRGQSSQLPAEDTPAQAQTETAKSEEANLPVYSPRRPLPQVVSATPQLPADEELARRVAAKEEILAREMKEDPPPPPPPEPTGLPAYSSPPTSPQDGISELHSSLQRNNSAGSPSSVSPLESTLAPRPVSMDATTFRSTTGMLSPLAPENLRSMSSTSFRSDDSSVMNPNQFIDSDLLLGVSVGFVSPSLTPELLPMAGTMPNIISLPYGRCPPLHLQAPSWRHILKLMARLSGSRMEPTVEAMAVTRSAQMNLRTVVQFVRPHQSSADWRTIVWFTIDHPVPSSMPGARKYINGDVDILPWSYTLSSLPALLRDGADTLLSKTYTIPASDSVPFPTLPISFPNMAMYLQAALEESRKYLGDSSSGVRKLAKMVETCYPTTVEPNDADNERSRVGGLFKKVIGRGGRKDKSKKGKGGNEDFYELVTPFNLAAAYD